MPLITPYLKCGLPSKNESKNISIYMHFTIQIKPLNRKQTSIKDLSIEK